MSVTLAAFVFIVCFLVSVISSFVLAKGLDKLGARLSLPAGLFGIATALGANSPEITSTVTALIGGHHELGLGIVVGSNIFNLAALLGLSAVVAGGVEISRPRLFLEGLVAVLMLGVSAALLFGYLDAWFAATLAAIVFLPYLFLLSLSRTQAQRFIPSVWLQTTVSEALVDKWVGEVEGQDSHPGKWGEMISVVLSLVAIIAASVAMVHSSVAIAAHWGVAHRIIGMLVLATLTGIPNVVAALRLAVNRRGATVFSEAMNSNTLNLLAGVCLPALVLGVGQPSPRTTAAFWWLLGMTGTALVLTGVGSRLSRLGGASLILIYLAFAASVLLQE